MDQAITEFTLWSPFRVNWDSARRNILTVLAKLAQLTVPTIKWNPVAGEILPITDNKATFRIVWQATGTPALILAIVPYIPMIFSILKSLVVGLIVVNGLKVITGTQTAEVKAEVQKEILNSTLTADQKAAALADTEKPAPEPSTPITQTTDLVKIAAIAGLVIVGGYLIITAMPRRG